jgi:hypothetical protein
MTPAIPSPNAALESARARLEHTITQQGLIERGPSLQALRSLESRGHTPGAVFLGVGLASTTGLSRAMPFDVLGMLLVAEHVRRALRTRQIVLLLADAHAFSNALAPELVAERAQAYQRSLVDMLRALNWPHARVVRARDVHASDDYRRLHALVRRRAAGGEHPYVTQEIADIEYFDRICGGILKVGWVSHRSSAGRDERYFDTRFRRWMGSHVGFVYTKAGRALDDRHRIEAPYVAIDPGRRICMNMEEDVAEKLARAKQRVSRETLRGVRNHLKAIARGYRQLAHPVSGPLEVQLQTIVRQLLCPRENSPGGQS